MLDILISIFQLSLFHLLIAFYRLQILLLIFFILIVPLIETRVSVIFSLIFVDQLLEVPKLLIFILMRFCQYFRGIFHIEEIFACKLKLCL